MKKNLKMLRLIPALMLLTVFVSAPVFAEKNAANSGSGESHTPVAGTTTVKTEDHTSPAPTSTAPRGTSEVEAKDDNVMHTTAVKTENSTETEHHAQDLRTKAEQKVAELKKDKKEHSAADRQNFCNLHKDNLQGHFNGLNTKAQAIQGNITAVFTKAQAFKVSSNLTVDNYDSLVATATAAQATVTADIAALNPPALDCTSPTVATDVAAFKASADQVKTDLKAYRDAVKNLVKAIKAVAGTALTSTDTTKTTTGGVN